MRSIRCAFFFFSSLFGFLYKKTWNVAVESSGVIILINGVAGLMSGRAEVGVGMRVGMRVRVCVCVCVCVNACA